MFFHRFRTKLLCRGGPSSDFHLVSMVLVKGEDQLALINLDQVKAFGELKNPDQFQTFNGLINSD